MKSINWTEVFKRIGIVILIIAAIACFIYFTAISLLIFFLTGGLFGKLFFFDKE